MCIFVKKYGYMYHLSHNISLKSNNTFGILANAKHYLTVGSPEDLILFFKEDRPEKGKKRLFVGAGSNLLFVNNFDGLVIHPEMPEIHLISENDDVVLVEAGAGVVWDDFVDYCVRKGWGGIENLSLIPGNVGAVPVQNIGAYGVEAESVISEVKGIDLNTLVIKSFSHADCKFGYRTSVFKEQLKEQFIVTSVVFKLSKHPDYQLQYGALEIETDKLGKRNLPNIRKAVMSIRESKLPDPSKVGNAGSFFKNPLVSIATAEALKNAYPDIPLYPVGSGLVKVAAGWLIEKAGWKGRSVGNAGVHDKQALVLINKGGATGKEVLDLSKMIIQDILQKYNIELEREVQVIGNNM
jgi:UDP-N-acetylmuramate dehydrogenase